MKRALNKKAMSFFDILKVISTLVLSVIILILDLSSLVSNYFTRY